MKLSKAQFAILSILWKSDCSLSISEITKRSKNRFMGKAIVRNIVEELVEKGAVVQSSSFTSYSHKHENLHSFYSAKIQFAEYYAEIFQDITPQNIFRLLEKMLCSEKLTVQMLQKLQEIIIDRIEQ